MGKWLIHVDVSRARGRQTWHIEADNEAQARKMWEGGDGELFDEELEAEDQIITKIEPA